MTSKHSQIQRILDWVDANGSITSFDAVYHLGILRLASRIHDIRKLGYTVETKRESVTNQYWETVHVVRYYITKPAISWQGKQED